MARPPDSSKAARDARRVRCHECGRRVPGGPECAVCKATFLALCGCGAEIDVFADVCRACGASHVPKRLPFGRRPWVRAARWSPLLAAAGAAAWWIASIRPVPAWKLKETASQAIDAGRYDDAWKTLRKVTEESPGDARAWYMLGYALWRADAPESSYLPPVRQAALLAPDLFEARCFLAAHELEAGRPGAALEHAIEASRAPLADARAFRLLAKIELAQPQPDLVRTRSALERARALGGADAETDVLLADLCLRTSGVVAPGSSRLPAGLGVPLRHALAALEKIDSTAGGDARIDAARARIALALGDVDAALAGAERALTRMPSSSAPAVRAGAELVRAMALHATGRRGAAVEGFGRALRLTPDSYAAGLVAAYFAEAGDLSGAEATIADAARDADPTGALHATLALLELASGDVAESGRSIESARSADPNNSGFAMVEARVRAAQGRWDEARTSLEDAVRLAPKLTAPRVELAMSALERPDRADRAEALRVAAADLERLRAETGDEPVVLRAMGRVKREQGAADESLALLRRAVELAPWDADSWEELAETLRRDSRRESLREAAAAFARAAALRPGDPAARIGEADVHIAEGDPAAALDALNETVRAAPRRADVLRRRAAANLQLGRWRAAVEDLTAVRAADVKDGALLVQLVDALFRAGDESSAQRLVAEGGGTQPPDVRRVLEYLAALHGGDPAAALERLRDAPPSALVAQLQLAAGRVEPAVETLRRVVAASPGDSFAVRLLVLALLDHEPAPPARIDEAAAAAAKLTPDAGPGLGDLLEGRILLARGDLAAAKRRLSEAERTLPADPFAALLAGDAMFRGGERDAGLASLRRAAAIPGAPPSFGRIVASRLLMTSLETADPADALRLAEEARRLSPATTDAGVRCAQLLAARGDHAAAAEALEKTVVDGEMPDDRRRAVRFSAALERFFAGETPRARALLDSLPAQARDSREARLLGGYVSLEEKRFDEADVAFAAALSSDGKGAPAAAGRVAVALARGRADEAQAHVATARKAHPDDAAFLARAAALFLRAGRREEASRLAAAAGDLAGKDCVPVMDAATTLARCGAADDAVARLLTFAATAAPDDATAARLRAGRILARIPGRADDAADLARRIGDDAAASAATRREASLLEAEALLDAGDLKESAAIARRLLAALPAGDPATREEREFQARLQHALGTALSASEATTSEAIRRLAAARALDGSNEVTANNLAWLFSRSRDTAAQGVALAREATAADPSNAGYWDTLGACAAAAGASDEAETAWRKAIELFDASRSPARADRAGAALGLGKLLTRAKRAGEAEPLLESVVRDVPGTPAAAEAKRLLGR